MSKDAIKILDSIIDEPFTFGMLIKNIRLTDYEGMTQREFAEMLGLSVTRLSDIENDRKPTSIKKAIELASKLGQSKKYFIAVIFQDMINNNHLDYKVDLVTA